MRCFYSILRTTVYVSLAMFLFSCNKETVYEDQLGGDLKGFVWVYNNNSTLTDYSGVTVTVDGSSPVLKTTTNEKGEYTIEGLKTGIYDLVFTKDSFATYKMISFQFVGGNVPLDAGFVSLYKLSYAKINDLKVDTSSYYQYYYAINVHGSLSGPSISYIYLRYYVSDSPDVSYTNYQATDYSYSSSTGVFSFSPSNTLLSKFPKGKQLYIILYSCTTSSSYIDINTGNQIYMINADKASAVVPFMIPNTITYF